MTVPANQANVLAARASNAAVSRRELLQLTALTSAGLLQIDTALAQTSIDAAGIKTSAGMVEQLKGGATAVTGGASRALVAKAQVFVADIVRTANESRLSLKLGQRTMVRLGENTELKIERYLLDAGGEIDLASGSLQFERTGKPAANDLKIRSPYGLIAVRGTRFYAGSFLGSWGVFVADGSVDVTGGGTTVRVDKGLGTDIGAPGGRPSDPKAWGAARIAAAVKATR